MLCSLSSMEWWNPCYDIFGCGVNSAACKLTHFMLRLWCFCILLYCRLQIGNLLNCSKSILPHTLHMFSNFKFIWPGILFYFLPILSIWFNMKPPLIRNKMVCVLSSKLTILSRLQAVETTLCEQSNIALINYVRSSKSSWEK